MKHLVFGVTDVGRVRENNQDNMLIDDDRRLYAVADGMGGHAAGEVASQLAISTLAATMDDQENSGEPEEVREQLAQAFREGNRRICESVVTRNEWRGMGTTIVAMVALEDNAVIGHVGDSRAYLLREGRLQRLTSDHSWVNEQVKLGLLTDDEAHRHPMRNIVTRALGNRTDLQVEITDSDVQPGDLFVLCSDGLNSMLNDDQIHATLTEHASDPEAACRALVEQANERGGEDNITVICVAACADDVEQAK